MPDTATSHAPVHFVDGSKFIPQSSVIEVDEWANLPLYLREKQVRSNVFPVSHGALWDWVAKGTFPPPIRLSSGVTAWKRYDLKSWADGTWVPEVGDMKEVV